jgi:DNA-binding MarR family transcriptional regulator
MGYVVRRSERSRVDPDLGVLTGQLTTALQRALVQSLGCDGRGEIGPRHRAILAFLDAEGSRAVDLARQSGQHKQVVGTLVDELERMGYVRREPDPSDRRAKLVVPTDQGRRLMARTDAAIAQIERTIAASLGEQRYRDFKRLLGHALHTLTEGQPSPG